MNVPNLNRVYHTFRAIEGLNLHDVRNTVLTIRRFIQNEVRCLVDDLTSNNLIQWFGFLVHNRSQYSGNGNTDCLGIHLRFELGEQVTFSQVATRLNELGWESSDAKPVPMDAISGIYDKHDAGGKENVQVGQLRDSNIAYAWKALGEASEWALDVLSSYNLDPVPVSQIRQHIHFISNLLYVYNNIALLPVTDTGQRTIITDF